MEDIPRKQGNYLLIDGGISGLPALYIIDEMGYRMRFDSKLDNEILLCRHFDLITGTGRGGLVAIFIGRLRLTPSKSIQAYMRLMPALALEPTSDDAQRKRNSEMFRALFQEVLKESGFEPDEPMLEEDGAKVVVYASNATNLSLVHPIRSYRTRSAQTPPCTILEAACACVASPETFLPVTIGTGHEKMVLVDALAVCANPGRELLREAQRIFGDDAEVATIVSIGAGKGDVWSMSEVDGASMRDAVMRTAVNCEPVHEELYARLRGSAIYYRLNVDKGSGRQMVPSSLISAYLQEGAVNDKLDDAICSIKRRPKGVKLKDINTVGIIEIALKPRPSLVQDFVGRRDILDAMHRTHITSRSANLTTPAITVLSGLGGSGKTQTALKFALEFETRFPDAQVYFLNASAEEALKADLETLIRSRGAEHRSKSYEDALRWLAGQIKDWLLILDNAENPNFRLFPYIPKCARGNVIITTRNSNHITLAPNSSHHLEGLSTDDAVLLILTASGYEITDSNKIIACRIVDELGHLPLALAQAAGYTLVHKCLETYLDIYHERKGKLLTITSSELPSDYPSSVATTIQMSLERLPVEAQNMMRLFSRLDSTSIAHEIVSKAAKRGFKSVVWTQESKVDLQTLHQAETLMNIFCARGKWSEVHFNELVTQCLQHSLLRLTTQGGSKFYSMHILVQSYLRSISDLVDNCQFGSLVVRLLGSSITYDAYFDQLAFNRLILPHIQLIRIEDVVEAGDHLGFGNASNINGNWRMSIVHLERCVELWKGSLGEEHKSTLVATLELARSYYKTGKNQKALELYEPLLQVQERTLGPEEASTLKTMRCIAATYSTLGRHQDALKLREQVLDIRKRVLGPEHRDTVSTLGSLAISYDNVGRHKDALELQEKVLELQKKILGEDDPDTLRTMDNIAASYWEMGRCKDSQELGEVVLEMKIRVLGIEHPRTLHTARNLLSKYKYFGMMHQLRELLRATLPAHEKCFGADHPKTIWLGDEFGYLFAESEGRGLSPAALFAVSSRGLQQVHECKESESLSKTRPTRKSRLSRWLLLLLLLIIGYATGGRPRGEIVRKTW